FKGSAVVVAGTPEIKEERTTENGHRIVPHLSANQLQELMSKAKVVLSRSGYSTVMDLSVIGGKAIFVPTPGQTEQQYLANLFHAEGLHLKAKQNSLNLPELLKQVEAFKGFEPTACSIFKDAVKEFVESC
ncbi:MAG: UDP-N-acetylglucosamine:LPS N-acetylglucosamine transferase, partial [Bacteroidia bacterium]